MLNITMHIWMEDGRMFYDIGNLVIVQGDMLFEAVLAELHNRDEWGGLIDAHDIVNNALVEYWSGCETWS